ncbi:hypothetical protein HDU67_002187 [Dinochytrium kinnereticum]|nr:hypothetical protein HDU67_002187 [Dinochytrium kinnereticum]
MKQKDILADLRSLQQHTSERSNTKGNEDATDLKRLKEFVDSHKDAPSNESLDYKSIITTEATLAQAAEILQASERLMDHLKEDLGRAQEMNARLEAEQLEEDGAMQ